MPIAKIEVCRSHSPERVAALIEAVYQAQIDALKVPEDDKQIRYIEHKLEHCPIPPGKTENYTFVEFLLFPGRTLEAKRKLYQGIVARLGRLGIQASDILIVLIEPTLENWGLRGQPASELDLGFRLDV